MFQPFPLEFERNQTPWRFFSYFSYSVRSIPGPNWADSASGFLQVFTRHFGPDVEQLGFRIRWSDGSGQPSVQMLEPNSAAQQRSLG